MMITTSKGKARQGQLIAKAWESDVLSFLLDDGSFCIVKCLNVPYGRTGAVEIKAIGALWSAVRRVGSQSVENREGRPDIQKREGKKRGGKGGMAEGRKKKRDFFLFFPFLKSFSPPDGCCRLNKRRKMGEKRRQRVGVVTRHTDTHNQKSRSKQRKTKRERERECAANETHCV